MVDKINIKMPAGVIILSYDPAHEKDVSCLTVSKGRSVVGVWFGADADRKYKEMFGYNPDDFEKFEKVIKRPRRNISE